MTRTSRKSLTRASVVRKPSATGAKKTVSGARRSRDDLEARNEDLTAEDEQPVDAHELDSDELDDEGESVEQGADLATGSEHIDDPVRIYLMQMGEIPLLSRGEEIGAARQIEQSRRRFRRALLRTDYMLQAAMGLLEQIRDGKLRLDRTIEVSVTNTTEHTSMLLTSSSRVERAVASVPIAITA